MKRAAQKNLKLLAVLLIGVGSLLYLGIFGAFTSCGGGVFGILGAWLGFCISYNGMVGELMVAAGVIVYFAVTFGLV